MVTNKGHYDGYSSSPLMEKQIIEGFKKPEPLGNVTISSKTLLDLKGDFCAFLDEEYAKKEALREAWYDDVMGAFGFFPMDGTLYDDDDDYYDSQYYGEDWYDNLSPKDARAKRI